MILILIILTFLMILIIFINYIINFIKEKKQGKIRQDITYTHYLLYDDSKEKYIVKEFDESINVLGVYCNTQNGEPILMIETKGWVQKPNSLGSKISHLDSNKYIITSEYIFTNEESAILQAIKLNNII